MADEMEEVEPEVIPVQFIQFANDALVVLHSDSSCIYLSPCGNQFLHDGPAGPKVKDNFGLSRVKQKTEFATSLYRDKVREALEFRNLFAERPFLCRILEDASTKENVPSTSVLPDEVRWAESQVTITKNGRYKLRSVDGQAEIVLAANKREFRVHYPVVMPPAPGSRINRRTMRVTQHCSVAHCPPTWRRPLELVLAGCADALPSDDERRSRNRSGGSSGSFSSPLPKALPLRCPNQHMHRFDTCAGPPKISPRSLVMDNNGAWWLGLATIHGPVKVMCLEGILYRFLLPQGTPENGPDGEDGAGVEIYPGDGSLLASNNLSGEYFTHYLPSDNGEVMERVYSATKPPPHYPRKLEYDLIAVVSRGQALCAYLAELSAGIGAGAGQEDEADRACWARSPQSPRLGKSTAALFDSQHVPDVGRFSAFENGRIHILFADRVALDMRADLSRRLSYEETTGNEASDLNENGSLLSCRSSLSSYRSGTARSRRDFVCPELPPQGQCRIFTREGHFEVMDVEHPLPEFQKHLNTALEWISWVNATAQERENFYMGGQEPLSSENELHKIRYFNYTLETQGTNAVSPDTKTKPTSNSKPPDVRQRLGRLTEEVEDRGARGGDEPAVRSRSRNDEIEQWRRDTSGYVEMSSDRGNGEESAREHGGGGYVPNRDYGGHPSSSSRSSARSGGTPSGGSYDRSTVEQALTRTSNFLRQFEHLSVYSEEEAACAAGSGRELASPMEDGNYSLGDDDERSDSGR